VERIRSQRREENIHHVTRAFPRPVRRILRDQQRMVENRRAMKQHLRRESLVMGWPFSLSGTALEYG
jgi:hypothetical protein